MSKIDILRNLTDEDIILLFTQHNSISAILTHLEINCRDPRCRKIVRQRLDKLGLIKKSININPILTLSNVDHIRQVALLSNSLTDLLIKLKLCPVGGNFTQLRKFLALHEIQLGKASSPKKWTDDQVYCVNSQFNRRSLSIRVLRDGYLPYERCAVCLILPVWNGKVLRLHLDHINGQNDDHRLSNLRWLCPNCHTQTSTYAGRNKLDLC